MDADDTDESVADALIRRAATVPYAFPLETNRLRTLLAAKRVSKVDIAIDARGVRPIMARETAALLERWLAHKRRHGTDSERGLYGGMDVDLQMGSKVNLRYAGLDDRDLLGLSI